MDHEELKERRRWKRLVDEAHKATDWTGNRLALEKAKAAKKAAKAAKKVLREDRKAAA